MVVVCQEVDRQEHDKQLAFGKGPSLLHAGCTYMVTLTPGCMDFKNGAGLFFPPAKTAFSGLCQNLVFGIALILSYYAQYYAEIMPVV